MGESDDALGTGPSAVPDEPGDAIVECCLGCGSSLVRNARFCAHCGLPAGTVSPEPNPMYERGPMPAPASTSATSGGARREGVPEWLAVVAGVAAVLAVWFVISRPSVETETTDDGAPPVAGESDDLLNLETTTTEDPVEESPADPTSSTGPDSASATADSADGTSVASDNNPSASLTDLEVSGWRLLVGDGLTIVDIDLESGEQTRHERVGTPISVVERSLLVYRDSRLSWLPLDGLDEPGSEIVEVAALQRMFTRGRSADRPVVVEGPAIWWPNNNANPQTWVKLRLADGALLDSISLSETVYGGPEVVATVGSGTFERQDGRWLPVGDLFAPSASPDAIVGQQCSGPDSCAWVLQRRDDANAEPQRLAVPVGGPFDLSLVADADRVLLLASDGVTDHGSGRFVPMVSANASTLTATNRAHVLAMADGAGVGRRSSPITIVDLDGSDGPVIAEVEVDDLIGRWLVLVPPPGLDQAN